MTETEKLQDEISRLSGLVDEKVADGMVWKRFAITATAHLTNRYGWKVNWDVSPPQLTPPESLHEALT